MPSTRILRTSTWVGSLLVSPRVMFSRSLPNYLRALKEIDVNVLASSSGSDRAESKVVHITDVTSRRVSVALYGEVVDVNLVRDKATGKSKGFAFLAYEDQRSTVLAVDNLNGARVDSRIIKVDHVSDYKRKLEEDEEEKQRKREERGVCYAFQRGECKRGDDCKFSHDEQRNSNTGWGEGGSRKDGGSWKHDQFDGSMKEAGRRIQMLSTKRNDDGMNEREDKPRGVCYAFQRGECNRGDGCKFAHDEQRNGNTGRGGSGAGSKHDQFDGSMKEAIRRSNLASTKRSSSPERTGREKEKLMKPPDDRRGRDGAHRSKDSDRGEQRRDDGSRRRDNDREDRGRDQDPKELDRRGRRDDADRDGRDRRDDRRNALRDWDDESRDRSRDVKKDRERIDRGDDGRDERAVRLRR
ncbi:uncharacterized protein [Physcomitrium patens]|uniref:uncharacterized protein isoform X2 n=1 Tax=Physcomitrium patens TaxID=3218 RepID=UPI003CCCA8A4